MTRATVTPKCFERARRAIQPVLAAGSAGLASELRRVVEYHWGWLEADGSRLDEVRAGKALRPTLALLAAEAVGADASAALPGAAAVEMIHDFTLLHDDVMDEDAERRGRPTAWTVFGVGPAICAGDALVLLAPQVLLAQASAHRDRATTELLAATQAVIAGQGRDLALEGRIDVTVADHLEMTAGKTGALLGGAAAIGAILGGGSDRQVGALRRYGEALGLAFQAVDDWLGIWGDPGRTGKPRASDLRQRKASLPIVMALSAEGSEADAVRKWMRSDAPPSEAALERAVGWLDALGTGSATRELAERELARALRCLDEEDLEKAARDELVALSRFVVERAF
jgi:geranylgeranyl diphosphate synthase type I